MTKIESLESMQKRQRKAIVDFYQSLNILSAEFNYNTISEENLKLLEQIVINIKTSKEKVNINKDDIGGLLEHEIQQYTNKWYGKISKEEFCDGIGNTAYDIAEKLLTKNKNNIKTLAFNINHYYCRKWKKRMYEVSVMEEINAHAKEGDGLVYSVKSLYNKRNIDYKKQAKELINILKKEFNK